MASLADADALDVFFPEMGHVNSDVTRNQMDEWTDTANRLAEEYERLLAHSCRTVWATVLYNSSFFSSFDAALDSLPKPHSPLYRLFYQWNDVTARAATRLSSSLLALYLRLAVHTNKMYPTVSGKQWLEMTRERGAMPLRRAVEVWAHFPHKYSLFAKVVQHWTQLDSKLKDDVVTMGKDASKVHSQLSADCQRLVDAFYAANNGARKLRIARLLDEQLQLSIDLMYTRSGALRVLKGARLIGGSAANWASGVPALVESIVKILQPEVTFDLAMTLTSYPLKNLLGSLAHLEQSAARFWMTCLTMTSSNEERYTMTQEALVCERFLLVVTEHHDLMTSLSGCDSEQLRYVQLAVEGACATQRAQTVRRLERYGLLEGLGELDRMRDDGNRAAVLELLDTLPHLSPAYAHLCMRHFDYSVSACLEALLSPESGRLPMDLRRAESAEMMTSSGGTVTGALPPLMFAAEDTVLAAMQQPESSSAAAIPSLGEKEKVDEKKNYFKGLFSLAPVVPSKQPEPAVSASSEPVAPTKTSLAMLELRAALDRVKMRRQGFEPQIGPNGEKLVPMMTSTKYAGAQKFKISAADKVAIRPTYERFKYETPDEFGMYDDEYDDGYEQAEFKVEPLNAMESSSDEGEETTSSTAAAAAGATNGMSSGSYRGGARGGQQPAGMNNRTGGNLAERTGGETNQQKQSQAPRGDRARNGGGGRNNGNQRTGGNAGGSMSQSSSGRGSGAGKGGRGGGQTGNTGTWVAEKVLVQAEGATTTAEAPTAPAPPVAGAPGAAPGNSSRTSSYTGGRGRQNKERHKNAFKQRGADRKMRGAF